MMPTSLRARTIWVIPNKYRIQELPVRANTCHFSHHPSLVRKYLTTVRSLIEPTYRY